MGDGNAECGHNGISDEFVKHPSLLLDALHHDGEILVQKGYGPLGAEFLSHRGETAYIGKEYRGIHASASEDIFPTSHELISDTRIHIPCHGRPCPLFAADILNHNHRTHFFLVFNECFLIIYDHSFLLYAEQGKNCHICRNLI